jgi:hypothetical protein
MSVSSIGSGSAAVQAAAPQPKPVDLPNDGDADDVKSAPVQSAPAPGTGQAVDKTA